MPKLPSRPLYAAALSAALLTAGGPVAAADPDYLRLPLMSAVPTLDPGLAQDSASIQVIEQLFLGLTDYHPETYEVVPELAESWQVSEDGKTYTFTLRDGVKWSDGEAVTAAQIEYATKRNIDPKTASSYAYMLYAIKNGEAINKGEMDPSELGVKALDDRTVEFTLNEPAGFFPAMAGIWTYRPLRQDIIDKHGENWTDAENIVTNGSYRLQEWDKGNRLVLEANPEYYEKVGIPAVHYYIVPEASTALAMYENGELDLLSNDHVPVPSPDLDRLRADDELSAQLSMQPSLCTYFIGFNNSKSPTDDVKVRKAITAAIDKQAIAERILKNGWKPANSFTAPTIFGNVAGDASIGVAFDPEQAKQWLAEAGYPDGEGFPEVTYMYNTSEQHAQIAQAIQALLKRNLNIDIKLANQEWKVFLKTRESDDAPHLMRNGWCADYMDAHNWLFEVLHPEDSNNTIKWNNPEYIEVVDKAMVSQDQDERKALYRRAEEILNNEQTAIAPLFYYADPMLVNPRVSKWAKMPLGGFQLRYWELAE